MPTQRAVASVFGLTLALMHGHCSIIASEFQMNRISITASDSVSVAGTNSHGGTTYVDVEVITSEVVIQPQTTITISVPITATFTWVEDASGIQESFLKGASETVVETCGFGADGRGTCVETLVSPQTTEVVTFSGNIEPLFTLVAATPSASKQNAALHTKVILRASLWNRFQNDTRSLRREYVGETQNEQSNDVSSTPDYQAAPAVEPHRIAHLEELIEGAGGGWDDPDEVAALVVEHITLTSSRADSLGCLMVILIVLQDAQFR
ncbi:hypothetical protein B0H19DRAFT_1077830 [Mycena capillaripes]|nr:hypothetical protein B0H19DRAFT_1077830 [Mycena capillaripes]